MGQRCRRLYPEGWGAQMTYKLIKIDGGTSYKEDMTLEEMQDFVGGYIEHYKGFYVNEDGLRLGLPRNEAVPVFVGNIIQIIKEAKK
jgi:hypothetical protein